ncbi:MAG: ATP-dependent zinc metalloprotease FtsH [Anaerolineae bacterium]|nr:ATP-dependent zinc metalloprotease FtsH [Anaerolineae bacterium]
MQGNQRIVLFLIIAAIIAGVMYSFRGDAQAQSEVPISDVARYVKAGEVERLTVNGNEVRVRFKNGRQPMLSRKDESASLVEQLALMGVSPEQREAVKIEIANPVSWFDVVINFTSILSPILLILFFLFIFRQAQNMNGNAMGFGRSRARVFNGQNPTVTFQDVAGAEEAKQDLQEVVEFLKQPEKFIQLGARIPKGVLLIGSPGTGKTLLAKAVSGEAGVPFFSISGSEFVEMFVGVGASRVRDLFEQAKKVAPCIIFVDEIDAVGRSRGTGVGGGHDEREQTLNQILVEMDGFGTDTNVIVIAATNRPDVLDAALMRPGRFDRRVIIDRPDVRGREAILKVHVRGKPLANDVDLPRLARAMPGFAGADIENLVNESAIMAARRNKKTIGMTELLESIERVMIGPERKSKLISEKAKRITAYHEAGHAIVAHLLPNCDPVQKITIIPRGLAGGYTLSLPTEDVAYVSRSKFVDDLSYALGGRAAEEVVFAEITTGASSDLQRVTEIARDMVTRYGMSDVMGPMVYGQKQEMVFLGRDLGEQRDYSDQVALEIDREVRQLVVAAYSRAKDILTSQRAILDAVSARLMDVETIEQEEFQKFFAAPEQEKPFNPRPRMVPSQEGRDGSTPSASVVPQPA